MTKCPKCGIQRSRKEYKEGYCEVCGWEQKTATRLQERKASRKARIANKTVRPKTEEDRKVEQAARFTEKVTTFFIEIWDQEEKASENPVICRNQACSTHKTYKSGHQIAFSWYQIRDIFLHGFRWSGKKFAYVHEYGVNGREGLYELAVHEFAHWLQCERGQRWHGSQHNQGWASAVEEIKSLCPFSEVSSL